MVNCKPIASGTWSVLTASTASSRRRGTEPAFGADPTRLPAIGVIRLLPPIMRNGAASLAGLLTPDERSVRTAPTYHYK